VAECQATIRKDHKAPEEVLQKNKGEIISKGTTVAFWMVIEKATFIGSLT